MEDVRDYRISVPSTAVSELQQKLVTSKFPDDTGDDDWEGGVPVADIKRVTEYWGQNFNWSSYEEQLNKLPHFETTISLDGFEPFELHFIHKRAANPDAIPLLFVHGCAYSHFPPPIPFSDTDIYCPF